MAAARKRTKARKRSAKKKATGKTARKSARKTGRPTRYRAEFAEQAVMLCRLGAVDKELAEFFGVSEATLNRWKLAHGPFREALKEGKSQADAEVADRLYRRATGYTHPAVKIMQDKGKAVVVPYEKHYPPDVVACIFWLKNRRPDLWRDKIGHEHSGPDGGAIRTEEEYRVTEEDEEVIKRIAERREKVGRQGKGKG